MTNKIDEKQQAVALRRTGKTYSEILSLIPVAKSTLSLWLREVGLSNTQQQTLTEKKRVAQRRGGARRMAQRLQATEEIFRLCRSDIKTLLKKKNF